MWGRRGAGDGRVWSLDVETTGLDPDRAWLLAVGMVPIVGDTIRVGEAYRAHVGPPSDAVDDLGGIEAHHLRPLDVVDAPPLRTTLAAVLGRLAAGDGLLVHHAPLDVAVLRRTCRAIGERWPRPRVIDTVRLIQRVNRRRQQIGASQLPTDLAGARRTLDLPRHTTHDALADAIATAELYLALRARPI